jgi:hypothetical protein
MISKEKLFKAVQELINDEMVKDEDVNYIKSLMKNYDYPTLWNYFKYDLIDADIYINNKILRG